MKTLADKLPRLVPLKNVISLTVLLVSGAAELPISTARAEEPAPGTRSAAGVETIVRNTERSQDARKIMESANINVMRFDMAQTAALKQVVGNCCGNPEQTTGLLVNDFKCSRPGKSAAACVSDIRSSNGIRDAQIAYRNFSAHTPPEMIDFFDQKCGGRLSGPCLQKLLSENDNELFNVKGFDTLALALEEKYGEVFDPFDVTPALLSWLSTEAALGVLEVACERVQGNFDAEKMKYSGIDSKCHEQPDYSVATSSFIGRGGAKDPSDKTSLSEVETGAEHWFTNDATRNRSHAVDLGEFGIPDPTGLLESSCPAYIHQNNSFKLPGKYAPACDPATGSVSLSSVYEKYVDLNVKDLLLREMAIEEMRVTGSNLALVGTMVPEEADMQGWIAAVERTCGGDSKDLADAFSAGVTEGKASIKNPPTSESIAKTWKDVASTVAILDANRKSLSVVDQTLKDKCGFFDYEIGGAFASDPMKMACYELVDQRKRLEDFENDAFRSYPFLAQKLQGSDRPLWMDIKNSMGLNDARSADLAKGKKSPTEAEGQAARGVYLKALADRKTATLERVKKVCADPQGEGLNNLKNPMIVGSFFDRDPGNKSAGWALCKAYADESLSETRTDLAWVTFNIGTLFIPGIGIAGQITSRGMAWAAVGLAGASALKTADDLVEMRDESRRNEAQYLAGAGSVSDYLRAKASQDALLSEVIQGGGLEAVGILATGLQVIPAFRGGSALLRLAEESGNLGRTLGEANDIRGFSRSYQKGKTIAARMGEDWVPVTIEEVLEGGKKLKVRDSRGVVHILDESAQVAHEGRFVGAAREAERTSEVARAQLTGKATASGIEIYIPRAAATGGDAQASVVTTARVGMPMHATTADGRRLTGTLEAVVREGDEVTALRVRTGDGKLVDITNLPSVRVGQDTWVAPDLIAQYRIDYDKWYKAFGQENSELLDRIIDIYTGRELMKDPAALAEITRLLGGGAVDLSRGLSAQVLAKLGDRGAEILKKARAKVEDQIRKLGGSCGIKG